MLPALVVIVGMIGVGMIGVGVIVRTCHRDLSLKRSRENYINP
jgi:hypothetical protein